MNRQSIFSLSVAAVALALLPTNVVAEKAGATPQAPSNVVIPQGYSMTAVATGLNFPTAMTFFGGDEGEACAGGRRRAAEASPGSAAPADGHGGPASSRYLGLSADGYRVCAGLVLADPPPDELRKCPRRTGRRDFAVPASRSGRDLCNRDCRISILWRSSEFANCLRCRRPRLYQWGRANQLRSRRA